MQGGAAYRLALEAVRLTPLGKALADMVVADCAYAARPAAPHHAFGVRSG